MSEITGVFKVIGEDFGTSCGQGQPESGLSSVGHGGDVNMENNSSAVAMETVDAAQVKKEIDSGTGDLDKENADVNVSKS